MLARQGLAGFLLLDRATAGVERHPHRACAAEHSYLGTPQYAALMESLMRWVEKGEKPTRGSIAEACRRHAARYEGGCDFDLDFEPRPLDERQYPR